MTTLRTYQTDCIAAIWDYLRASDGNPCAVLPTGAGKTPVLVNIAREAVETWNGRVLILAHVKELLAQAVEKFQQWWPMAPVGLYSAGLRSRDTADQIIVAGIQSVHRKADQLGRFDLVIVDEAHLIPQSGDGMYRKLIADLLIINPLMRVIGLTATPYRLDCGLICGAGNILTEVCYEAKVRDLIDAGFLSKLRGKAGHEADVSSVHSRGGDYIQGELESALADDETVALACDDIIKHCSDRKAWVIFCAGVKHAEMVSAALAVRGIAAPVITGDTPAAERDELVEGFKSGDMRALCNINVLSLGFDAPHIDAVIMLRPTQSPGLYYQQVGRGLRLAPGKSDCLVLDLAGNVREHGPIDQIDPGIGKKKSDKTADAPTKACPACSEILAIACMTCTACGHEFPPPPIAKHATKAEAVEPLSAPLTLEEWDVTDLDYSVWTKRGADTDAPRTLRVTYLCGLIQRVSEWICLEHPPGSYARKKAEAWWRERSDEPIPATLTEAASLGNNRKLKEPTHITVAVGGKWPELRGYRFVRPCSTCAHFDGAHCMKWERDVPADWVERGCDAHQDIARTYVPDDSDEAPF